MHTYIYVHTHMDTHTHTHTHTQGQGFTALYIAAQEDSATICQLLLEAGADPSLAGGEQKLSPLHIAAHKYVGLYSGGLVFEWYILPPQELPACLPGAGRRRGQFVPRGQ